MKTKLLELAERLSTWLIPQRDRETEPRVDVEYVASDQYQNRWITVAPLSENVSDDLEEQHKPRRTDVARCNLCGRVMDIAQMPELLEHVAEHDGQGQAKLNPHAEDLQEMPPLNGGVTSVVNGSKSSNSIFE